MGRTIFELDEELLASAIHDDSKEHYLIIDLGEIFDQLETKLQERGEVPIYGTRDNPYLDSFLFELFNRLGYMPAKDREAAQNILPLLEECSQYFDRCDMTLFQRDCWVDVVKHVLDAFVEHDLYDHHDVHRWDYDRYHQGVLYLKLYSE